jgi:SPX domain protein involved in polyphosphate accumulation
LGALVLADESSNVLAADEQPSPPGGKLRQRQGDVTAETPHAATTDTREPQEERLQRNLDSIHQNPGEVLFFKLLHAEFKKAVHFFDRAIEEFAIREERVVEGMEIVENQQQIHVWSMLAKSVYRFHTDLLLLETFCIMTYCSFSKILKKHDKVTGLETRHAFMSNIVNKANFTSYTTLQQMINRCEQLYSHVSARLAQEGQQGLYEDERLFIEMIHQLNQQA